MNTCARGPEKAPATSLGLVSASSTLHALQTMRHMITVIVVIAIVFAAMCLFLYVRQDSLLFYPQPNDARLLREWQDRRVEVRTGDRALVGWWARGGEPDSGIVILYFGGNAEDVLYTASTAELFAAERMLVVNYRGYGLSKGKPGQDALFEDAREIYDYVRASGVSADRIVVMGRSLGSGVAAMLAAEREVRGAVLITPFDSLAAVAAHHYRLLPVRVLLRHRFPSADYARRTRAPALIVAAESDAIVPPIHAQRLATAWRGPHSIHVLEGVGHNDIDADPSYYTFINEFLRKPPTP